MYASSIISSVDVGRHKASLVYITYIHCRCFLDKGAEQAGFFLGLGGRWMDGWGWVFRSFKYYQLVLQGKQIRCKAGKADFDCFFFGFAVKGGHFVTWIRGVVVAFLDGGREGYYYLS